MILAVIRNNKPFDFRYLGQLPGITYFLLAYYPYAPAITQHRFRGPFGSGCENFIIFCFILYLINSAHRCAVNLVIGGVSAKSLYRQQGWVNNLYNISFVVWFNGSFRLDKCNMCLVIRVRNDYIVWLPRDNTVRNLPFCPIVWILLIILVRVKQDIVRGFVQQLIVYFFTAVYECQFNAAVLLQKCRYRRVGALTHTHYPTHIIIIICNGPLRIICSVRNSK